MREERENRRRNKKQSLTLVMQLPHRLFLDPHQKSRGVELISLPTVGPLKPWRGGEKVGRGVCKCEEKNWERDEKRLGRGVCVRGVERGGDEGGGERWGERGGEMWEERDVRRVEGEE